MILTKSILIVKIRKKNDVLFNLIDISNNNRYNHVIV